MATKKEKSTKVSAILPVENVKPVSKSETAKKPSVKKTAEKSAEVESKPTAKAPVQKEEKSIGTKSTTDKKATKAKASKTTATPIIEKVEEVVTKVEEAVKDVIKKVTKPAKETVAVESAKPEVSTASESIVTAQKDVKLEASATSKQGSAKITFNIKYSTQFGERIFLTGSSEAFGNGDFEKALPLQYLNQHVWYANVELPVTDETIQYNYFVVRADGSIAEEKRNNKSLSTAQLANKSVLVVDTWNAFDYDENNLSGQKESNNKTITPGTFTHTFQMKAPGLPEDCVVFISGNDAAFGSWSEESLKFLSKESGNTYSINLDLTNAQLPVDYKYGIYDTAEKRIVELETGDNRVLYITPEAFDYTIVADGLISVSVTSDELAV